jgi:hypothetical protein
MSWAELLTVNVPSDAAMNASEIMRIFNIPSR